MGKPKPAAAGRSTVPAAEQLAALEAELATAGHDPSDEAVVLARAEIEQRADRLRAQARAEADTVRLEQLAAQEAANYAAAHGQPTDTDTEPEPDEPEPAGEPAADDTTNSGE